MGRYDEDDYPQNSGPRQKDLVLATNEFVYVQSKTNGQIKVYTGPIMLTISAQESLVVFNQKSKRFEETQDFERARQLFVTAPEGWYIVLKNPAKDNEHPETAKAVNGPDLQIGHKINIAGPVSFSLFPGQMHRVIRGHRLRSNQYLLARVYDADAAKKNASNATVVDAEGNTVAAQNDNDYFAGQLLIIKGTEVSFYIPPTGIEVIPVGAENGEGTGVYVRDAVTLERLEYTILKDEDGEKRYIHGPAVVFPKPTETFVTAPKGGVIFRALELSPISGIYVKVIAAYDDKDKDGKPIHHNIGEELFITGKDQMIYYPRPEHAIIEYDGKYMHHAMAIPAGEGRYILNRLTGTITTVKGPQMYLPDPRTEVVVKRKLTDKECRLLYPNNTEVLAYNSKLTEQNMERLAKKGLATADALNSALNCAYSTSNQEDTLAIFEVNANISRGTSYTKPRTITLDTKFDGVVSVDVWTGYAINVVSKTGTREVVVGPTTRLLDYEETVECMTLSTGRPKTTDNLLQTAFLRIENNKVSDLINCVTKDYVDVSIKVSYCVNFLEKDKDKWFSVENYVKYMCDHMRSLLKREVKNYTVQEFYANSTDIVRNIVLNLDSDKKEDGQTGRYFPENGMLVYDVEVLSIGIEPTVQKMFDQQRNDLLASTMQLDNAKAQIEAEEQLSEIRKNEATLKAEVARYKELLAHEESINALNHKEELQAKQIEMEAAANQARKDAQVILNEIKKQELERERQTNEVKIEYSKQQADIEADKQKAYADTLKEVLEAASPDLVAALTAKANAQLFASATETLGAYSIARGESVADTVNTLVRGSSFEKILDMVKLPSSN